MADAASLRAACEELLDSGRDQEHLLDSLLTLATSERGLESREPLDLSAVVAAVVTGFQPEADRTSVELSERLQPTMISGDRALVERLVANLVDNALRYNRPHGRVEIETGTDAGGVTLLVSNTGRQIPAEDLDRLFEPFQRLENNRAGGDGHHGLGLSIVQAVAKAHGATVTAAANPDGGLGITVRFPALPA
jgi:signal transduction histidine kinase